MDIRNPKGATSSFVGLLSRNRISDEKKGSEMMEREMASGTLIHCTKRNSQSYYFTPVFCESVMSHRSSSPFSCCRQVYHIMTSTLTVLTIQMPPWYILTALKQSPSNQERHYVTYQRPRRALGPSRGRDESNFTEITNRKNGPIKKKARGSPIMSVASIYFRQIVQPNIAGSCVIGRADGRSNAIDRWTPFLLACFIKTAARPAAINNARLQRSPQHTVGDRYAGRLFVYANPPTACSRRKANTTAYESLRRDFG
ncbi:hypothetical protein EVAR_11676_1 [Eumeta japonica]|uniref:Uncharacterized protein n=1 Tax=Eumeta variegata TaxID=151549 RepID=A0A4C1U4P1_EUMVA|nr:hypothetical protein EVAR_11676_1 [Eumeta japonica]